MKKLMHICLILVIALMLIGCEGKQGPRGVVGPQGEKGDRGDTGPGTRIVYQSTTPIPYYPDTYLVNIPEVTLGDMPSISVYAALASVPDLWFELPTYFENYPDFGMFACFAEGKVGFMNCGGLIYKIVIVK